MGKGSGGTRASSSSSPRGLSVSAPAVRQLYSATGYRISDRDDVKSTSLGISVNDASAEKDRDILDSVMGQLSDGIWENSRAMEKNWKTMEFGQDENGNVVLKTVPDYRERMTRWTRGRSESYYQYNYSGMHGKSDADKKAWVADRIRDIISNERKYYNSSIGKFTSGNMSKSEYLTRSDSNPITVDDAYRLYLRLKRR